MACAEWACCPWLGPSYLSGAAQCSCWVRRVHLDAGLPAWLQEDAYSIDGNVIILVQLTAVAWPIALVQEGAYSTDGDDAAFYQRARQQLMQSPMSWENLAGVDWGCGGRVLRILISSPGAVVEGCEMSSIF